MRLSTSAVLSTACALCVQEKAVAKFMDEVTRLSAQKYFWRDKAKASVAQAEKALDAAHKHAPILRAPQTLSTSAAGG